MALWAAAGSKGKGVGKSSNLETQQPKGKGKGFKQAGEQKCRDCGLALNRAWRSTCFFCNAP
eukprot:7275961-Lingulodinium_polyedra.AAC.1